MSSKPPNPASSASFDEVKRSLLSQSFKSGALKFGSFVLKSGRVSPYFFNAGLLSTGSSLSPLAQAYAHTLRSLPQFDVIFGPAYKGIPFSALATYALFEQGVDVEYAYNRKEVKDHGEGGSTVGAPLKRKRVVVLDDVMTSGLAVRESLALIRQEGGEVVGVVVLLDREEVGREGKSSVEELRGEGVEVRAVLGMGDLVRWLEEKGMGDEVERMGEYREQYGVKH
ncbi:orotate phosphoribosyltransferase [Dacryopinax primogenitus]|uniref:orotate phosphoribosyltransferase n=1 Tax=Dacryopinax primogenitus (strain DJM 731) TaxID=1858805 RepID=M5FV35_DACPD|nr:orotate phosphoribosyltransferase [Dacryopinax primogenitus]EJT99449.1 orotate phosphoribosyltransferase [Dacryopinax primogenitus]